MNIYRHKACLRERRHLAHYPTRANSTLKPSRPGFGPAAEPPGPNITRSASRWLQIASARMLTRTAAATAPLVL